ncbi:competence pheromone ComX [Bacillus norwichensis]|uniref:ComX pheromone n=1 Tax=Bacillus norwichensis TaxID=2762217 RepID=A0ABR8VS69_9BACI|nr:competence pheromone ComX [Bacillus norwichensis]MBD8007621.1 competence pheromone ComX [Bacillus norwichensis]
MLEMVQYLLNSPDVLVKVKEGTASLIGVNEDQLKAIMDAFSGENISPKIRYWK